MKDMVTKRDKIPLVFPTLGASSKKFLVFSLRNKIKESLSETIFLTKFVNSLSK